MITQTRPNDNGILVYDIFIDKGADEAFKVGMTERSVVLGVKIDTAVPFQSGDYVIFTVKDSKGAEIIKKTIYTFTEDGDAVISIASSDTIQQKTMTYKYDVIANTAAYGHIVIMQKANFAIDATVGDFV